MYINGFSKIAVFTDCANVCRVYTMSTYLSQLTIKTASSCEKQDIRVEDTLKQTIVETQGRHEAYESSPKTA